ncbi:MAG TPA: hypothetical protein VF992_04210 [Thermoplasmata archaeon]
MTKRDKHLTTIQLTTETRDRIFRLKFRKTYDEFLRELCDLFESANADAQK